jgi:hypothetical protein
VRARGGAVKARSSDWGRRRVLLVLTLAPLGTGVAASIPLAAQTPMAAQGAGATQNTGAMQNTGATQNAGAAQGAGAAQAVPSGWFPGSDLFRSLRGDPLEPGFRGAAVSTDLFRGGVRGAERALPPVDGTSPEGRDWQGVVSFGESFPVYRFGGEDRGLQVGLVVGVTARFRLATPRNEYLASDWIVGLPVEGVRGPWSARGTLFHRSAHLGDEIIEGVGVRRVGFGHEGVALLLARTVDGVPIRLYGGGTWLARSETSGTLALLGSPDRDRWELQGGVEWEQGVGNDPGGRWVTMAALDLRAAERTDWRPQGSLWIGTGFRVGREIGLIGVRVLRGPSIHGEFFLRPETAVGLEFRLDR